MALIEAQFRATTISELLNESAREYSLISRESLCAFPMTPTSNLAPIESTASGKKKTTRAKKEVRKAKTQKPSERKLEGRKKGA